MGMFDQNDSITEEFFTSEEEQVENETAESNDEEVLENNNESESEDNVVNEDESSTTEQDESELIAGKFKSQDDLVNAYKNLEKEFTKNRQQNKQQQEITPPVQQQTQQNQENDPADLFWNHMQSDPFGTLSYLIENVVAQKTAPIYQKEQDNILGKDIDNLANDFKQLKTEEGLTDLFNKAHEIASGLGNEQLARNPKVLKMAAIEAFGDPKADLYKKAKAEGVKEAEQNRQTKQELSTISSSKKPAETPKTAEDEVVDSILQYSNRKGLFS